MGGFLQTFPLTIFFNWKQLDAIATLVLHDVLRIPFGFAGSHVVDPANTTINKTCFVDRKCSLIFDAPKHPTDKKAICICNCYDLKNVINSYVF